MLFLEDLGEIEDCILMQIHLRIVSIKPRLDLPTALIASSCSQPISDHFSDVCFRHGDGFIVSDPIFPMMRIVLPMMLPCTIPLFFGAVTQNKSFPVGDKFDWQELRPIVNEQSSYRKIAHPETGKKNEPFVLQDLPKV